MPRSTRFLAYGILCFSFGLIQYALNESPGVVSTSAWLILLMIAFGVAAVALEVAAHGVIYRLSELQHGRYVLRHMMCKDVPHETETRLVLESVGKKRRIFLCDVDNVTAAALCVGYHYSTGSLEGKPHLIEHERIAGEVSV